MNLQSRMGANEYFWKNRPRPIGKETLATVVERNLGNTELADEIRQDNSFNTAVPSSVGRDKMGIALETHQDIPIHDTYDGHAIQKALEALGYSSQAYVQARKVGFDHLPTLVRLPQFTLQALEDVHPRNITTRIVGFPLWMSDEEILRMIGNRIDGSEPDTEAGRRFSEYATEMHEKSLFAYALDSFWDGALKEFQGLGNQRIREKRASYLTPDLSAKDRKIVERDLTREERVLERSLPKVWELMQIAHSLYEAQMRVAESEEYCHIYFEGQEAHPFDEIARRNGVHVIQLDEGNLAYGLAHRAPPLFVNSIQVNRENGWIGKIKPSKRLEHSLLWVEAAHVQGEFGLDHRLKQRGISLVSVASYESLGKKAIQLEADLREITETGLKEGS
ncbi:MAG TPA: hypothetical protein VJG90_01360 [Candidatus Nanoarchaeia archaeon]|nr:hypothetical protein [Candidatus Nanoarchaeia archaeon]